MRLILLSLALSCGGPLPAYVPPDCGLHSESVISSHSIKRFPGLIGAVNPNTPPEGAAEIDQDVVHRSINVTEPRRGYRASASLGHPLNAIAFKQGKLLALTYNTASDTGQLNLYDPAADSWSNMPMNPGGLLIDRPGISGAHTRFVSANKAIYFQSAYGLTKVEDVAKGVCRAAVQPKPWSSTITGYLIGWWGQASLSGGSNLWLSNGNQVAYRVTVARHGANGELIESEPCDRMLVSNTLGSASLIQLVLFNTPWMLPPDAFYRIYRSKQVSNTTDPPDEMFLITEVPSQTITDGSGFVSGFPGITLTVTDQTGDGSLYEPLYTNPQSGDGIQNANTPAAMTVDMAWFKNRNHLLNTSDVQRLTIKIIGTGTGGIQDRDSLTVAGVPFFFSAASGARNAVFLYTGGTVAQNTENTARLLVQKINLVFGEFGGLVAGGSQGTRYSTVAAPLAYYISSTSTDAGQILIQSAVPGSAPFTVQTSSSAGWDRDYTAGTSSDPNAQAAGWMWSLFGEPEAVPTANNDQIGDPTAAGQRLIALKDTLFAFKQDGLWKITDDGSTVGPQVQLVDPTIRLVAPETAVAVDNMIFALCDQGVVKITETGAVENISHIGIERDLFKLMAYVGSATLAEKAFGVAYLPEHTYILCLPESPSATSCTKQYVYNLLSGAWSSWNIPGGVISGAVNPDTGQLYFGRADGTLCIERKDFTSSDYQDPGFSIASPATTITKTMVFAGDKTQGANTIAVGDIIQQWQATNALSQKVVAVSYSSGLNQTTVTLDNTPRYAWAASPSLTVVKAIQSQVKFLPFTIEEPLTDKDWENCYLSFRYCDLDFLSVGWTSEKVPLTDTAIERVNNADGSHAPIALEQWGAKPWGSTLWGRQAKDVILKCTMPQDFGYAGQLTLSLNMPCALSHFELSAIDTKLTGTTDKIVR